MEIKKKHQSPCGTYHGFTSRLLEGVYCSLECFPGGSLEMMGRRARGGVLMEGGRTAKLITDQSLTSSIKSRKTTQWTILHIFLI